MKGKPINKDDEIRRLKDKIHNLEKQKENMSMTIKKEMYLNHALISFLTKNNLMLEFNKKNPNISEFI